MAFSGNDFQAIFPRVSAPVCYAIAIPSSPSDRKMDSYQLVWSLWHNPTAAETQRKVIQKSVFAVWEGGEERVNDASLLGYQTKLWLWDSWVTFLSLFSACLTRARSVTGRCETACPGCRCVKSVSIIWPSYCYFFVSPSAFYSYPCDIIS